jgi:hypothetical protein
LTVKRACISSASSLNGSLLSPAQLGLRGVRVAVADACFF